MNEPLSNTLKGIASDGIDLVVDFVHKVLVRAMDLTTNESDKLADSLKKQVNAKIDKNKSEYH